MRDTRLWGIGFAGLVLAAGCASSGQKPCMIIPAQIELARDVRDEAQGNLETRQTELGRIKANLSQSQEHRDRLVEERDQLRKEVGGGAGSQGKAPAGQSPSGQNQAPAPQKQEGK